MEVVGEVAADVQVPEAMEMLTVVVAPVAADVVVAVVPVAPVLMEILMDQVALVAVEDDQVLLEALVVDREAPEEEDQVAVEESVDVALVVLVDVVAVQAVAQEVVVVHLAAGVVLSTEVLEDPEQQVVLMAQEEFVDQELPED